jgi:hypothetical protein
VHWTTAKPIYAGWNQQSRGRRHEFCGGGRNWQTLWLNRHWTRALRLDNLGTLRAGSNPAPRTVQFYSRPCARETSKFDCLIKSDVNTPTKAERIEFWKYSYARSSFVHADQFARCIFRNSPALDRTLRDAINFGIITAYGRPFKQRSEVRLSGDIVSKQHRAVHDDLIEMRDKVVAHRDLDGPVADWGFVSQVQVFSFGNAIEIHTLSPIISGEMAEEVSSLCVILIELMTKKMEPFLKYLMPPPPKGRHVVSLENDPAEWLQQVESAK